MILLYEINRERERCDFETKGKRWLLNRRENGPKRLADNNEAQTLSARMPRASPKAPS